MPLPNDLAKLHCKAFFAIIVTGTDFEKVGASVPDIDCRSNL
ncbi:hypothetical protein AAULR_08421, partial [Lacticaseibacillus rhamnosus MTCC 5462]